MLILNLNVKHHLRETRPESGRSEKVRGGITPTMRTDPLFLLDRRSQSGHVGWVKVLDVKLRPARVDLELGRTVEY
jgi:hypothetical protein